MRSCWKRIINCVLCSTKQATIVVNAPNPIISPSATNSICVGGSVNFNAANVVGAVSYVWNFNDGSAVQTITATAIAHSFTNAGAYSVSLTTTDANGCQGKAVFPVYVQNYEKGLQVLMCFVHQNLGHQNSKHKLLVRQK